MKNQKLLTFINKFKSSQQFAAKEVVVFLKNNTNAKIIEDFNRQQLAKGKDSKDVKLGDYGETRSWERERAGLQVGFIDLKFTEKFHESIFVNSGLITDKKAALFVGSSDPKFGDIMDDERFKSALGLNQEDRDKVGFMIAQHLQKELLRYYSV